MSPETTSGVVTLNNDGDSPPHYTEAEGQCHVDWDVTALEEPPPSYDSIKNMVTSPSQVLTQNIFFQVTVGMSPETTSGVVTLNNDGDSPPHYTEAEGQCHVDWDVTALEEPPPSYDSIKNMVTSPSQVLTQNIFFNPISFSVLICEATNYLQFEGKELMLNLSFYFFAVETTILWASVSNLCARRLNITRNDLTFGRPIISTDTNSQSCFVH